jgi:hypothetical protein
MSVGFSSERKMTLPMAISIVSLPNAALYLEEVFCYAIEKSDGTPSTSGKIGELFNQVKDSYNMKQGPEKDNRVNDLVNGLWKIIESVASFRNMNSDSHGVGSNRLAIKEHHAMLYLNATITVATFVVAVTNNNISASEESVK